MKMRMNEIADALKTSKACVRNIRSQENGRCVVNHNLQ